MRYINNVPVYSEGKDDCESCGDDWDSLAPPFLAVDAHDDKEEHMTKSSQIVAS